MSLHLLRFVVLLLSASGLLQPGLSTAVPPPAPRSGRQHFGPRRAARSLAVSNPLIERLQVKADSLRGGSDANSKRQNVCQTPLPSGGCSCSPGYTLCTPQGSPAYCALTSNDASNCGSCGTTCPSAQICSSGSCACPTSENPDYCFEEGICTNLMTDLYNCHYCTNECSGPYRYCVDGVCEVCDPTSAMPTNCNGVCTNTDSDDVNCGACGAGCLGGSCHEGGCECGAGTLLCDGSCIACPAHSVCGSNGQCACDAANNYSDCGGTCIDVRSDDPNNCGACGSTCAGGTCLQGICTCPEYMQLCDGFCVDNNDPSNCGSCGTACGAGAVCIDIFGTESCQQCSAGTQVCNNACWYLNDPNNCGSCGNVCPSGQECYTFTAGLDAGPDVYVCDYPTAQCSGSIQVWGNGEFYGYLVSEEEYSWSATSATPFSIECGGGTELTLMSLTDPDYPYVCAAYSDGAYDSTEVFFMTGCSTETLPGSAPTGEATYANTNEGNYRLSETMIWNMDPTTFEITATWIDTSGSPLNTYVVDLGYGSIYVTTDYSGDVNDMFNPAKFIVLTLILGTGPL